MHTPPQQSKTYINCTGSKAEQKETVLIYFPTDIQNFLTMKSQTLGQINESGWGIQSEVSKQDSQSRLGD